MFSVCSADTIYKLTVTFFCIHIHSIILNVQHFFQISGIGIILVGIPFRKIGIVCPADLSKRIGDKLRIRPIRSGLCLSIALLYSSETCCPSCPGVFSFFPQPQNTQTARNNTAPILLIFISVLLFRHSYLYCCSHSRLTENTDGRFFSI